MASNIPEVPASLKAIGHYLKTAQEHDSRDPIVSYWCRLYALQLGMKINSQGPEERKFLIYIMDWLEATKKANADNDCIIHEVAAQAYLENYALKLFLYADKQDRAGNFGKNVVKAFYTAGMLYDVMQTFGELTEEVTQNRKYAKWKASYIHNCLKNGETPVPGPMKTDEDTELDNELGLGPAASGPSGGNEESTAGPSNTQPQAPYPSMGFQNWPQQPGAEQPPQPHFQNPSGPPSGPTNFVTNDPFSNVKAPTPPSEPEKPPGGFQPYTGPAVTTGDVPAPVVNATGVQLTPDQLTKAQKYCKWAGSALNYEDVQTAIDNLQKALRLLQTGQDS